MSNGSFLSYKGKRTTKKKGSRVERTKCCRTDFGASLSVLALSLFSAPSLSVAGFRGSSHCFEDRPCTSGSTPNLFSCSLRRSEQRSASVRRLVRSYLIRAPSWVVTPCSVIACILKYIFVCCVLLCRLYAFPVL